jgi:hypothetical protein
MSINATIRQLQEAGPGITALLSAKLPMKAKYAVSKLADAVNAELKVYGKARDEHFRAAGCTTVEKEVPNPDAHREGQPATIKVEVYRHDDGEARVKALQKEVDEMADATVTLSVHPLNLDHFGAVEIEGPAFLGLTGWAIAEDAPPAKPKSE